MTTGALLLLTIGLVFGCGDGGSSTTSPGLPPPAGVPFQVTDLRVGTGPSPIVGQPLTVNYVGWLYDENAPENKGRQVDSAQNFQFVLGVGQVIAGWDQGFNDMRVGGLRRLIVPPELAYGDQGAGGVIPPNATLVFDIELVSVP